MTVMKKKTIYRLKSLCVVLCCFLLSSCSFSFVYNNADWWVNWYLDDYVTLNKSQQNTFDLIFKEWHQWHRETQLPLYQAQLNTLQTQVNKGIIENNLNEHFLEIKRHLYTLRERIAPDLMQLSLLLTSEQKQEFLSAIHEKNVELNNDINEESDSLWYKDRCKSRQSQIQKWIGKLSNEQKTLICHYTDQMTRTSQRWLQYRIDWLNAFKTVLNQPTETESKLDNFNENFSDMIIDPERFMSDEYKEALNLNRQINQALYVDILSKLSTSQLNTFNNRIEDFIVDLHDLEKID